MFPERREGGPRFVESFRAQPAGRRREQGGQPLGGGDGVFELGFGLRRFAGQEAAEVVGGSNRFPRRPLQGGALFETLRGVRQHAAPPVGAEQPFEGAGIRRDPSEAFRRVVPVRVRSRLAERGARGGLESSAFRLPLFPFLREPIQTREDFALQPDLGDSFAGGQVVEAFRGVETLSRRLRLRNARPLGGRGAFLRGASGGCGQPLHRLLDGIRQAEGSLLLDETDPATRFVLPEGLGAAAQAPGGVFDPVPTLLVEQGEIADLEFDIGEVADSGVVALYAEDGTSERFAPLVQRPHETVEGVALPSEFVVGERVVLAPSGGAQLVHRLLQLRVHGLLSSALAVEVETEAAEPAVVEPLLDHIQGRGLLAHEEDALAVRQQAGDHVGDRLALSGSRRAVDHLVALAPAGRFDGAQLTEVGVHYRVLVADFEQVVESPAGKILVRGQGARRITAGGVTGLRFAAREPPHEGMGHALLAHPFQVLVHGHLGEGEGPEEDLRRNRPGPLALYGVSHRLQVMGNALFFVLREREIEAEFQQVRQRDIRLDFVVFAFQVPGAAHRLAHQVAGDEGERRSGGLSVQVGPFEESDRQEQHIEALFLFPLPLAAAQTGQPPPEFLRLESAPDRPVPPPGAPALVEFDETPTLLRITVQPAGHLLRSGLRQRDGGAAFAEVEQPVAPVQLQEFLLPAADRGRDGGVGPGGFRLRIPARRRRGRGSLVVHRPAVGRRILRERGAGARFPSGERVGEEREVGPDAGEVLLDAPEREAGVFRCAAEEAEGTEFRRFRLHACGRGRLPGDEDPGDRAVVRVVESAGEGSHGVHGYGAALDSRQHAAVVETFDVSQELPAAVHTAVPGPPFVRHHAGDQVHRPRLETGAVVRRQAVGFLHPGGEPGEVHLAADQRPQAVLDHRGHRER